MGINGYHTVILVPPSCSNIVPPFHNLTKAPICVVIKTLKWSVLSQQEMIIMHTFKWVILADVWWGIAFCAQNLVHIDLGKKNGVFSSHSGQLIAPSSNSIPLLIWLSFLPILWLFGFSWKLFPLRRSMICVYKLKAKKSKKKKNNRRVTGWYQRQWYNFFLQRGNFLFLNQRFSLRMSKFLYLLFSLVISCFKKWGKIVWICFFIAASWVCKWKENTGKLMIRNTLLTL